MQNYILEDLRVTFSTDNIGLCIRASSAKYYWLGWLLIIIYAGIGRTVRTFPFLDL